MDGGTLSSQQLECFVKADGVKECPFAVVTNAKGKFYDICYEMAQELEIEYETHCDFIDTRLDCNRVNTCEWDAASNKCQYSAAKRLAKAAKKGKGGRWNQVKQREKPMALIWIWLLHIGCLFDYLILGLIETSFWLSLHII